MGKRSEKIEFYYDVISIDLRKHIRRIELLFQVSVALFSECFGAVICSQSYRLIRMDLIEILEILSIKYKKYIYLTVLHKA